MFHTPSYYYFCNSLTYNTLHHYIIFSDCIFIRITMFHAMLNTANKLTYINTKYIY